MSSSTLALSTLPASSAKSGHQSAFCPLQQHPSGLIRASFSAVSTNGGVACIISAEVSNDTHWSSSSISGRMVVLYIQFLLQGLSGHLNHHILGTLLRPMVWNRNTTTLIGMFQFGVHIVSSIEIGVPILPIVGIPDCSQTF